MVDTIVNISNATLDLSTVTSHLERSW